MSYYQGNDLKKPSGGKKHEHRGKRKYELGSPPTKTSLAAKEERETIRAYGGNIKVRLKASSYINVAIGGEIKRTKLLDVVETPENPQNSKFKIISRGSVVKTELGLVKITSRPGQHGVLNGILIQQK
ncbi:MAG: 30S ribosomal protein S8e [Desulfurococcaceae archaeon]